MRLAEGKKRCGGERPCAWPTDEVWIHRRCVVPAGGGTCSVVRRGCDPDLHRIGTAWVVFVGCVERSGTHQPTTILFRSPIYPFYPFTHFGVGRPSVCPTDEVWIHRRCFVRSGGGTCNVVRRGCNPDLHRIGTAWVVFVGCVERSETHQPTLGCVTARWGFFTVVPMRFGLRPARILRFFRLSPFAFRLSPFAFSIYPFTHLPIYPFTR
jgi:hypothetical protein